MKLSCFFAGHEYHGCICQRCGKINHDFVYANDMKSATCRKCGKKFAVECTETPRPCTSCDGSGVVTEYDDQCINGQYYSHAVGTMACPDCDGTGKGKTYQYHIGDEIAPEIPIDHGENGA